jgi:hypothetical protein
MKTRLQVPPAYSVSYHIYHTSSLQPLETTIDSVSELSTLSLLNRLSTVATMMKLTAMQGPARNALRQHNLAHRYASVAPAKSLIWRANDADRRSPEEQAYASTASYTTRNASTQSRNTTSPYILPPVLAPPSESSPQPLVPKPAKGLLQKLFTRYSFKGTQDRIHRAEALYQAVTRQATDPYVLR